MPVNTQFISGSVRYIISEIADEFAIWELTNNEIEQIKKETQNSRQRNTRHKVNPQIKNVVYILLESFLSVSSDLFVDGKEITPFLNRLKKDSNTYYN
jgi:lipoteichoic acid synthase